VTRTRMLVSESALYSDHEYFRQLNSSFTVRRWHAWQVETDFQNASCVQSVSEQKRNANRVAWNRG
jgi:anthranilate/para-aminobenzoate synthase component II